MSWTKKAKLASFLLLASMIAPGWAADFDDAQKQFRKGHCRKAIEMGNRVVRESPYAPQQVKEDWNEALRQWEDAIRECENSLPPIYRNQLDRFENEYAQIMSLRAGAAKTDAACDLLRKASLFMSEVKRALAECRCREKVNEVDSIFRRVMIICPEPCNDVDEEVENILKRVSLVGPNIKMSQNLFSNRQLNTFRRRIQAYRNGLLQDKAKADSLMETMDFCLGRKGNRNLGLIVGTTENLARGLGYVDEMCRVFQVLHRRANEDSVRNKNFRDSVDTFFSQVNTVMDQWLQAYLNGDQPKPTLMLKSTSEKMHDMFFKLAKIDLERSLLLLDSPIPRRQKEVIRLRSLSFYEGLTPQEATDLDQLRNQVAEKLYLSIPWPIRFWNEDRQTAILVLCLAGGMVLTMIIVFIVMAVRSRRRSFEEMQDEN